MERIKEAILLCLEVHGTDYPTICSESFGMSKLPVLTGKEIVNLPKKKLDSLWKDKEAAMSFLNILIRGRR